MLRTASMATGHAAKSLSPPFGRLLYHHVPRPIMNPASLSRPFCNRSPTLLSSRTKLGSLFKGRASRTNAQPRWKVATRSSSTSCRSPHHSRLRPFHQQHRTQLSPRPLRMAESHIPMLVAPLSLHRAEIWQLLSRLQDAIRRFIDNQMPTIQGPSSASTRDDSSASNASWMLAPSPKPRPGLLRRLARWIADLASRLWDIVIITLRTTEVTLRLSPLIILVPAAILSTGKDTSATRISDFAWWYTISAVQGLGPVAVKLCQWIATRRDIFPAHVCDRLCQLHDSGYPHSWSHTHAVLTQEFGDYEAKGLTVGRVLGCGSAAQVYEGTLRVPVANKSTGNKPQKAHDGDDGNSADNVEYEERKVAIKVLHPHFRELVDKDLAFIAAAAKLLHSLPVDLIKLVNLPRVAETFDDILRLQSDLTVEANNLRQFRSNFYGYGKKANHKGDDDGASQPNSKEVSSSIVFPKPYMEWTTQQVLVETLVEDAVPIASYLQRNPADEVRKQLAGPLLRAFLKMVFWDNFIHGDLHPGNVMVQRIRIPRDQHPRSMLQRVFGLGSSNLPREIVTPAAAEAESASTTDAGTTKGTNVATKQEYDTTYSIVFLDAGISTSLSSNDQRNLVDLFRAIIFNDGRTAGRLMVERAKYERCSQTPGCTEEFASGIQDIVSEFHDRRRSEGLTLGRMQIGSLLSRVLDLCRVHGVEIDPAMSSVVISTLVLEGLGRSLEPNLNLLDFAKPFVLGIGRAW